MFRFSSCKLGMARKTPHSAILEAGNESYFLGCKRVPGAFQRGFMRFCKDEVFNDYSFALNDIILEV